MWRRYNLIRSFCPYESGKKNAYPKIFRWQRHTTSTHLLHHLHDHGLLHIPTQGCKHVYLGLTLFNGAINVEKFFENRGVRTTTVYYILVYYISIYIYIYTYFSIYMGADCTFLAPPPPLPPHGMVPTPIPRPVPRSTSSNTRSTTSTSTT